MGNNETFVPVGIERCFTENWPIAKNSQTTFYSYCGHYTFVCNCKFPVSFIVRYRMLPSFKIMQKSIKYEIMFLEYIVHRLIDILYIVFPDRVCKVQIWISKWICDDIGVPMWIEIIVTSSSYIVNTNTCWFVLSLYIGRQ